MRQRNETATAMALACCMWLLCACSSNNPPGATGNDPAEPAFSAELFSAASSNVDNPYFPLVPGLVIHLAEDDETVVISVLDETKVVDGVETRVVEERETEDGELTEISRNYFATDKTTGDVYYFGEDVDVYEDEKVASHEGAWLSGVDGAKFGLMMPGKPTLGDKYYQEVSPEEAMDRAEIVKLDTTLKTPLRTFTGVVYCRETSPLEGNEVSHKWYARGVGMIGDDELRVVKLERPRE